MSRLFNRSLIYTRSAHKVRRWIHAATETPDSLAWVVFAAVGANTIAYVVLFSNPVIRSDAWYFLDVFVSKALDGTLQLGDFFVQRGGMDHTQPLRKLVLLIDLRYFHLDFRYEALAGWFAAMISLLIFRRMIFWHNDTAQPFRGPQIWIWAALCVALVSLNSTDVWNWPLVTGGFTSYVFLFATLLGLWRWLALGRPALLVPCILILDFAADDVAMLTNIACLLALGIAAWQNPSMRKRVLSGAAILIACLILVRISYALLFTPPEGFHMAFGKRLDNLWSNFLDGGWWQWIIIPLASSVGLINPLEQLAGNKALAIQILIGVCLLMAHAWFWWRVLRKRLPMTAPAFAGIALMLVFYALLAGIIYGRVSIFGNSYLNQPRYELAYSFNLLALLLMCATCQWKASADVGTETVRKSFVLLMALFIAWQIPLSRVAWKAGPYVKAYEQKMAQQLGEMSRHPGRVPVHCAPELVVCTYPTAKRTELINLLKSHRLNVFSPQVQRATGLDPDKPAPSPDY